LSYVSMSFIICVQEYMKISSDCLWGKWLAGNVCVYDALGVGVFVKCAA
jgi:hypothetical protein